MTNKPKIEFVSYSGSYPNLCRGKLVIKIDGKNVSFGKTKKFWGWEKEDELAEHPSFWVSGGCCGFDGDYSESYVCPGDWEMEDCIHEKDYPNEIWNLLPKILELMNDHVPCGCCGGCL